MITQKVYFITQINAKLIWIECSDPKLMLIGWIKINTNITVSHC